MWKLLWELLGDIIVISLGALSIRLLLLLQVHGEVLLVEPSKLILGCELALAGVLIAFGIQRLIDDLKGGKQNSK
jgi:hypothetical protein